jgi:hypothetical protein
MSVIGNNVETPVQQQVVSINRFDFSRLSLSRSGRRFTYDKVPLLLRTNDMTCMSLPQSGIVHGIRYHNLELGFQSSTTTNTLCNKNLWTGFDSYLRQNTKLPGRYLDFVRPNGTIRLKVIDSPNVLVYNADHERVPLSIIRENRTTAKLILEMVGQWEDKDTNERGLVVKVHQLLLRPCVAPITEMIVEKSDDSDIEEIDDIRTEVSSRDISRDISKEISSSKAKSVEKSQSTSVHAHHPLPSTVKAGGGVVKHEKPARIPPGFQTRSMESSFSAQSVPVSQLATSRTATDASSASHQRSTSSGRSGSSVSKNSASGSTATAASESQTTNRSSEEESEEGERSGSAVVSVSSFEGDEDGDNSVDEEDGSSESTSSEKSDEVEDDESDIDIEDYQSVDRKAA